jgi:hypothetical protein
MRDEEPRPDTTAAGNALLWLTGSLLAFGVFLVGVPGQQTAGRPWLWVGIALVVVGGAAFAAALRARLRYLRR